MLCRLYNSFCKHWAFYRRFPYEAYGEARGVYASFEEAIADAPKTKPIGYNDPALAEWYIDSFEVRLFDFDYPALFWLERLLEPGSVVTDFGGNVGTHFRTYREYLSEIENVVWQVVDLPEIVRAGSSKNPYSNLKFYENVQDAESADILLASGSIQYLGKASKLLQILPSPPKHLLINRLALYEGPQFVTLQNGGHVFYPCYVFNRTEFISDIESFGYRLVDNWKDRTDSCFIPFRRKERVPEYDGLYFVLTEPRGETAIER